MLRIGLMATFLLLSIAAPVFADVESQDDYGDGCYGSSGTPQETIATCSPLIASPTESAMLAMHLSARASAYEQLGDYDRAIADLARVISINPNDATAHRDRANVEVKKMDFAAALADMDQMVRLRPDDSWSYSYRGWANMMGGNYHRALEDLDHSILMDEPGSWWAHFTRAKVFLLLGKIDEALADYDSALAITPGNAHLHLARGVASVLKNASAGMLNDDFEAAARSSKATSLYAQLWIFAVDRRPWSNSDGQLAKSLLPRSAGLAGPAVCSFCRRSDRS
jgi:tetratricopeptide (TPR) repeat protein